MKDLKYIVAIFFLFINVNGFSQKKKIELTSGNPIFPGWYADPEAHIYNKTYWVYPTYSDDYKNVPSGRTALSDHQKEIQKNTITKQYLKQTFLDAFSSPDLIHWKKHPHILDIKKCKMGGVCSLGAYRHRKGWKILFVFWRQ